MAKILQFPEEAGRRVPDLSAVSDNEFFVGPHKSGELIRLFGICGPMICESAEDKNINNYSDLRKIPHRSQSGNQ